MFGCFLYEMFTGRAPYSEDNFTKQTIVDDGWTPERALSKTCPAALRSLMADCWHSDCKQRPTAREINTRVSALLDQCSVEGSAACRAFAAFEEEFEFSPVAVSSHEDEYLDEEETISGYSF
jgi:hypothetical protein